MIHIPKKLFTVRNYNKYYTSIIGNNQCLFSFNNKETANKCALFLSEYRHRYGKWPELKNYEDQIKDNELQLIEPSKRRPLLNIFYNDLYVSENDLDELQGICLVCNIELLDITEFDYTIYKNKIDIDFKAASIQTEYDETTSQYLQNLYILILNKLFDNNIDNNDN